MFPYFEVDYVAAKLYVWNLGFCGFLFCMTSSMFNILYSWICYFYKSYVATKKWSLPSVCLFVFLDLQNSTFATTCHTERGSAGVSGTTMCSFGFLISISSKAVISFLFLALYSLICWTQYSLLHGARISWVGERDYDAPNWVHKCLSCPPANEPSSFFCIKLNPGTSWSPNSTYLHLDLTNAKDTTEPPPEEKGEGIDNIADVSVVVISIPPHWVINIFVTRTQMPWCWASSQLWWTSLALWRRQRRPSSRFSQKQHQC